MLTLYMCRPANMFLNLVNAHAAQISCKSHFGRFTAASSFHPLGVQCGVILSAGTLNGYYCGRLQYFFFVPFHS
jgi:hypothetical protein